MRKSSRLSTVNHAALFDFTVSIQPARRAWLQAAAIVFQKQGLSIPLGTMLLHIAKLGDQATQSALAKATGVNPAAVVRTLDQGEAAKLITRQVGDDRRMRFIALTDEGKSQVEIARAGLAELRVTLLSHIEIADIAAATRVLRAFEDAANHYVTNDRHI
jgi:MarR family transcriptional regulator for hemolysin